MGRADDDDRRLEGHRLRQRRLSDAVRAGDRAPADQPLGCSGGEPRCRRNSGRRSAAASAILTSCPTPPSPTPGTSIAPDWQLYGWAGYQHRHTSSAAFPRPTSLVSQPQATLAGYPQGFIPLIDTVSSDINSAIGVKGIIGDGWNVDVNASYGRNKVTFHTGNSANYSLGAATPHNFYDGALIYDQLVGNLDVTKTLPVFESLNVAFGLEGRREGYQITPGELAVLHRDRAPRASAASGRRTRSRSIARTAAPTSTLKRR